MFIIVQTPNGPRRIPQDVFERLKGSGALPPDIQATPEDPGFAQQAQQIQQQAAQAQQAVQQEAMAGRRADIPDGGVPMPAPGGVSMPPAGPDAGVPPAASVTPPDLLASPPEAVSAPGYVGDTPVSPVSQAADFANQLAGPLVTGAVGEVINRTGVLDEPARESRERRQNAATAQEQALESRGSTRGVLDNSTRMLQTREGELLQQNQGRLIVLPNGVPALEAGGITDEQMFSIAGAPGDSWFRNERGNIVMGQNAMAAARANNLIPQDVLDRAMAGAARMTDSGGGGQGANGPLVTEEMSVTQRGLVDPAVIQAQNAMDDKLRALQQEHLAGQLDLNRLQSEGFGQLAQLRNQQIQSMAQADTQAANEFRGRMEYVDRNLEELRRSRVNPEGFFGEGGEGAARRFGAAVVTALGALASNLTGGPNNAMNIIQSRIQDNVEAQVATLANRRAAVGMQSNALSQLHARLNSESQARDAMYAMQWQAAINQLQSTLTNARAPMMQAGGNALIVAARLQQLRHLASLQQNAITMTSEMTSRRRGGMTPGDIQRAVQQRQMASWAQPQQGQMAPQSAPAVDQRAPVEADLAGILEDQGPPAPPQTPAPAARAPRAQPRRRSGTGGTSPQNPPNYLRDEPQRPRVQAPPPSFRGLEPGGDRQDFTLARELDQDANRRAGNRSLPGGIQDTERNRDRWAQMEANERSQVQLMTDSMFRYEQSLVNILDLIEQGVPQTDRRMTGAVSEAAVTYANIQGLGALSGPDQVLAEASVGPTSRWYREAQALLDRALGSSDTPAQLQASLVRQQRNYQAFLRARRLSGEGTNIERLRRQTGN